MATMPPTVQNPEEEPSTPRRSPGERMGGGSAQQKLEKARREAENVENNRRKSLFRKGIDLVTWPLRMVVKHPILTALAVFGGVLGWKFLKDKYGNRILSEMHLWASRAGWKNWRRDVETTTRTLGGEHGTPPSAPWLDGAPATRPPVPGYENWSPPANTRPPPPERADG